MDKLEDLARYVVLTIKEKLDEGKCPTCKRKAKLVKEKYYFNVFGAIDGVVQTYHCKHCSREYQNWIDVDYFNKKQIKKYKEMLKEYGRK